MIRKIFLPLLIVLIAITAFIAIVKNRPQPEKVEAVVKPVHVSSVEAAFVSARPEITLYGKIDSPRTAQLKAALNADLLELNVVDGERVKQGDVLLRLDDRDPSLILAERQAQLADLEAQIEAERLRHESDKDALPLERRVLNINRDSLQRAQKLLKQKLGSQAQLDEARAAVEKQRLAIVQRELSIAEFPSSLARLTAGLNQAKSLVERARIDLEHTLIRAPFDGRVAKVSVSVGDRVRSGDTLIELFDESRLRVRAQLPNRYIPVLRRAVDAGQALRASAELDGRQLALNLRQVGGQVSDTGSVEALLDVVEGGRDVPLGRFVTLRLGLPVLDSVMLLPPEALYGTDRVYSIVDDKLFGHRVKIHGDSFVNGERRLIVSDVPGNTGTQTETGADSEKRILPGDRIVTSQLPNAINGLLVKSSTTDASPR